MIGTIARKELTLYARDGRVLALAALLILLGVAAAFSSWNATRALESERLAATAMDREIWNNQGPKNPHSAAHFARYAFRPASSLAIFDPGVTDYVGGAVWLEAHYRDPASLRPIEDAVEIQRFAELSPAWILQTFAPLLAILLVFGSIAGERESGTLRQVMASGARPAALFWGKGLAALAALLLLAPIIAVTVVIIGASDALTRLPDTGLRLTTLIASYGAYLIAFTFAAIGVSARVARAKTALVALIGFWALATAIAPQLAVNVGEAAHPSPQGSAFWAQLHEESSSAFWGSGEEAVARRDTIRDQLLAEHQVDSVEELPINYDGYLLQASEEFANGAFDRLYGELWDLYDSQSQTARLFSLLSPTIALKNISSALSGTDVYAHTHFTDAAELYRRDFIRILNEDMIYNAGPDGYGYQSDNDFWAQNPDFEYTPPGFADIFSRIWIDLLIVAAWCAFGLFLAFGGVRLSFIQEART